MNYFTPSWKQFHSDIHTLTEKIAKDKQQFDLIVGIARGGLTVSHIVSDFLRLPVASFTVSSYRNLKRQELSEITHPVGGNLKHKRVLLIDDCSDSGKTFLRGIEHLQELGAQSIATGAVYIKPWTSYTPHYFAQSVDRWIVFPFDIRDTIVDVSGFMKKEGKTTKQIEQKLHTLKIPDSYIKKYFR